jgi:RNA polymerase sigma-70 factor (ECF subfamily)
MAQQSISDVVQYAYRHFYGKMVTALVSYFGLSSIAMAEDIVQDTFVKAIEAWEHHGIPDHPEAWLFKVCKNKTLNMLSSKAYKTSPLSMVEEDSFQDHKLEHVFLDHEIKDNQLRLLFACCHPALSPKAQIIFILKNLCGLRVDEIARGLSMTDEAVMKTHSRSRQALAEQHASLKVPYLLRSKDRLHVVHTAIYLLFNEGYSATEGDEVVRSELCLEAMRLMRTIMEIPEIRSPDTYALMALMTFHVARFDARLGASGEIIELEVQNRSDWDHELIALGSHYLRQVNTSPPSRFIIEASIAAVHCAAPSFRETPWDTILGLYKQLRLLISSPFVELNMAVAIFYRDGAEEALRFLQSSIHLHWMKNHYLYYALLGKIYLSKNERHAAVDAYKKALSLTKLKAEQEFLKNKISTIES